jgi:hypothetical protein
MRYFPARENWTEFKLPVLQRNRFNRTLAEACGSRTQTLDSQLTANDDVAASAKFQLESERFTLR